ncbi:MAG: PAS domain S-box protein [Thermodesulfobacteriota bacterium]
MSHNLRFLKFFNPAAVLLLGAILFPVLIVFAQDASLPSPVNLTPVERTWLDHNPDKLVLWFNTEFPPIEFISDKGEFIGMGADVIALVEQRLGVTFIRQPSADWNLHLAALATGECAIAPTIVSTPERKEYLFFTPPYATVPVVIITRRGDSHEFTMDDLAGKRVAVVSGYATESYAAKHSLRVGFNLVPVPDVAEGLREVSLSHVDAFLENLAVAAYTIEKEGISNLCVAGTTDYSFAWSIGVSRKYPVLYSAVQKALGTVSESELSVVHRKWITLNIAGWLNPETWRLIRIMAGFGILLLISLVVITYILKRRLKEKITRLEQAQQKIVEQADRLRLATEALHAGVWDSYPIRKKTYLSRQWCAMLGYPDTARELPEEEFVETFIHPDDRPVADKAFQAYFASNGQGHLEAEFRLRRADGTWCWVLCSGRAVEWDETGAVSRIIGLDVNIQSIKEGQERLTASEARFRAVFENAPYAIVISDFETGQLLAANNEFLKRRAVSREDVSDGNIWDFSSLSDDEVTDIINTLWTTGAIQNREVAVKRKDGSTGYVLFSSVVLNMDDKKQILTMTVDVTEGKRAQQALEESEARFRAIFENAPYPIIMSHPENGKILAANNEFLKRRGLNKEALAAASMMDFSTTPVEELKETVNKLRQTGAIRNRETTVTKKDGSIGHMVYSSVMVDIQGQKQVLTITLDVTERKRAQQALEESEARFRALFKKAPIPMATISLDGRILEVNDRLTQMLGYTLDEIPTLEHWWRLAHPDPEHRQKMIAGWNSVFDRISTSTAAYSLGEIRVTRKDGTVLTMIINTNRIREFIVASFFDITPRKKAEAEKEKLREQLLQAQKLEAVGVLAGGVAHDFNNMLGAIIGFAELALEAASADDPQYKYLENILQAARHSADLTGQLLAFARKQTIAPTPLDINESVEAMLKILRRLLGENIDLAWRPGPGPCTVKLDPSQLNQVVTNLCINARDAIANVGKITIETAPVSLDSDYCDIHAEAVPGEYVMLAVSDDGSGMDRQTMDHVFDPFFTTKQQGKGTGLGLATVYGIVRQNKGFINVYSEPGRGSTFRIYFPRHGEETVPAGVVTPETPTAGRNETLLLVEDDPVLLDMTTLMLRRLGYTVMAAATPGDAMRLAEAHRSAIDLFVTDVVMPEMNGRDLAARIQAICPGIRLLFMSGYTANVIVHQGVLEKGLHFIQKPFSLQDLAAKVREALESHNG